MALSAGIDEEGTTAVALLGEAGAVGRSGSGPSADGVSRNVQSRLKLARYRPIRVESNQPPDPTMAAIAPTSTDVAADTTAANAGRPDLVRVLVAFVALAATGFAAVTADPRVVEIAPVVFGLLVVSFVVL